MDNNRPLNIWDLQPKRHVDVPERAFFGSPLKEPNAYAAEAASPPNEPPTSRPETTLHAGNAESTENAYISPPSDEAFAASRHVQPYSNRRDGRFVDPFSRRRRDVGSPSHLIDSGLRRAGDRNSQDQLIDPSLRGNDIASSRFIDYQPATEPHEDDYVLKRGEVIELDNCAEQINFGVAICKRSGTGKLVDRELRRFREAVQQLPYMKSDTKHRNLVLKELNFCLRGANIPADIREDARYIILRWEQGDFNTDLFRGIEKTRRTKAAKLGKKGETTMTTYAVKRGYAFRRNASEPGENHLVMGQWWPRQICAVRDGAHGELEAGIAVGKGGGAVSVVLSGTQKSKYPNNDDLDVIEYCGTRGAEGRPTAATAAMMEAQNSAQAVRVLRSSKSRQSGKNYAPVEGIRYDGLYQVVSFEVLDKATSFYRFKLVRMPGQSPVRWKGPLAKPTPDDRKAFLHYQIECKIESLND